MPQKLPKKGVNKQFQAKTPKYTHRDISGTNATNKRFEDRVQTTKGTSWVVWYYRKANTRRNDRDRNQKKNINMADICFSKPEVVISQP